MGAAGSGTACTSGPTTSTIGTQCLSSTSIATTSASCTVQPNKLCNIDDSQNTYFDLDSPGDLTAASEVPLGQAPLTQTTLRNSGESQGDLTKWTTAACEARCAKHVVDLGLSGGCCATNPGWWCRWAPTQTLKGGGSTHNAGVCTSAGPWSCTLQPSKLCNIANNQETYFDLDSPGELFAENAYTTGGAGEVYASLPNSPLDQSLWSKAACEARCAKHVLSLKLGSGAGGCCSWNQDATPWCRWGATQATKGGAAADANGSGHNAGVCSAPAIDRCVTKYGQCGILETNAEAVCLAWPECGGVVCRADYGGYCLARRTMDASLTTTTMWAYTKGSGSTQASAPVLEAKIQITEVSGSDGDSDNSAGAGGACAFNYGTVVGGDDCCGQGQKMGGNPAVRCAAGAPLCTGFVHGGGMGTCGGTGVPFKQNFMAKSSSGGVLHYFVFTCKTTACTTDVPTASRLTSDLVYRAATLIVDFPELDASIKSGAVPLSSGQWMTSGSWWAELSKVRTKSIVIFGAVKNADGIMSNVIMLKFIAPGTTTASEMQVVTTHDISATRYLSVKASMYHIYMNAQCVMKPGNTIPTSMVGCTDGTGTGIECAARECNTNGPACGGFIEVKYPSSSDKQIYLGDATKRELYAEPWKNSYITTPGNCYIKAQGVIKFALFTDSGTNIKPYVVC